MCNNKNWSIEGSDGQPILGNTHVPTKDAQGVVLLCHGFKGYKDYGFFAPLCRALASRGLIAHRFNFSHSGMTNKIDTFERPDLFEKDTWGRQIADLHAVARAVADGRLEGAGLPMTWFGHSRGGVTVLLTASRTTSDSHEPEPDRLIIAATPHQACNFDEATRSLLREQGYLESPSNRTGQTLRVGRAWLDEIEANPDDFDPVKAARRVRCPVLILHGDDDQTVSLDAAHALADAADHRATVTILPAAGHTFNAPNPPRDDQPLPEVTQQFIHAVCDYAAP